jgi:pyruvate dehydrogenase E2 component (dihydrolipoamide acetyltransferase)
MATDTVASPTRSPFSAIRKRIARHMVASKATSPHVAMGIEVDLHAVATARRGTGIGYFPFVAWSTCRAIAAFPRVNATVDGDALEIFPGVDLGIAVDLDFEGLVVPVVRDAQDLGVRDLGAEIARLSDAARSKQLSPDDVRGGTYTISNVGGAGTLFTTPIINQPQVAILSVDGIRKRPVVVEQDGRDEVAVHEVGVLVQSFDHRAFDGAYSAAFLARVRNILETTDWAAEIGA